MVRMVTSQEAWEALAEGPAALIDVRTTAEWNFVGLPDLSPLRKRVVLISWQDFPSGAVDPDFVARLAGAGLSVEQPLYFLCRSGSRSQSAAEAAFDAGYRDVYNVADGFEGPADGSGRRSRVSGWKFSELPWHQN